MLGIRRLVRIGTGVGIAAALSGGTVAGQYPLPTNVGTAADARPPTSGEPTAVEAGDLAARPDDFFGRRVRVTADVGKIVGPQSFLLDEHAVLVITRELASAVSVGLQVTVTGIVRRYDAEGLRKEFAWNWWERWTPELAVEFDTRPVIVADSVRTGAGAELVAESKAEGR